MIDTSCFRPLSGNEFKNALDEAGLAANRPSIVFVPFRGMSLKTELNINVGNITEVSCFRPLSGNEFKNGVSQEDDE